MIGCPDPVCAESKSTRARNGGIWVVSAAPKQVSAVPKASGAVTYDASVQRSRKKHCSDTRWSSWCLQLALCRNWGIPVGRQIYSLARWHTGGVLGGRYVFGATARIWAQPDEAFRWQEDASITEHRKRRRKRQICATCVGATLALVVIGHAVGLTWHLSAVAGSALKAAP